MNFIEQFFGISFDGGNGMFELLLILLVFLCLTVRPLVRAISRSKFSSKA